MRAPTGPTIPQRGPASTIHLEPEPIDGALRRSVGPTAPFRRVNRAGTLPSRESGFVEAGKGRPPVGFRVAALFGLFFLFLGGVGGLSEGFEGLGSGLLDRFFEASTNPILGLLVGMLATTLLQSSSVTSSLIVALVVAPVSPLPFESAIPMIMGANIGTTVTNTFAALGHLRDREQLRRAFAAATCHDMFNLLAVAILLPLEVATGLLARLSTALVDFLGGFAGAGFEYESPLGSVLSLVPAPLFRLAQEIAGDGPLAAGIGGVLSATLIVVSLGLIVRTLRGLAAESARESVHRVLGRNAALTIAVGALVTIVVQSSSVTTSLLVPLAAAGLLRLDDAFPVTLGANIGTTVTAFFAALAASGPNAGWGFQLAVVHLLFNVIGIALIYPAPRIREIPLSGARFLARVAVRSRPAAVAYVIGVFYGVPALLLFLTRSLGH